MKPIQYILFISLLFLSFSCKRKQVIECTDPYAINFNKMGEEAGCEYPSSLLKDKPYNMKVAYYPLQPSQEGDQFQMRINTNTYCSEFQLWHGFSMDFNNASFTPEDLCFDLRKDMSFTRPDTMETYWASGYLYFDSCRFYGNNYDSVYMHGQVYNSGTFHPVIFKNY